MERIHFKSWTLGKAFTVTEWDEWCRTHDSNYVVATFDRYKYNVYGRCLNMSRSCVVGKGSFIMQIYTSLVPYMYKRGAPLKWEGKIYYMVGVKGGWHGFDGFFENETDCVIAGLKEGRAIVQSLVKGACVDADKFRNLGKEIDMEIAKRQQMALF